MTELILTSPGQRPLRSLVEAALHNELRLLQAAMRRTDGRFQVFETQYDMSSAEFLRRYEHDELQETLEFSNSRNMTKPSNHRDIPVAFS